MLGVSPKISSVAIARLERGRGLLFHRARSRKLAMPRHKGGRVKRYEDSHSNHHQSAVQADKVLLVRHQMASPALDQLNRPKDVTGVNGGKRDEHGNERKVVLSWHIHPGGSSDEVDCEAGEDGHGD